MAGTRRFTDVEEEVKKQEFLESLEKHNGVLKYALEDCDLTRWMVGEWERKDSVFKGAMDDVREAAIDYVERQLFAHMKRGSTAAVIFYLKTKAKHRGYVERQEVSHEHLQVGQVDPGKLSSKALKEILANYDIKESDKK